MRNNRSLVVSFAFVVMAVVAPGLAHAQGMTESVAPRVWLGAHFGLSPVGSLKATAKANGNEASMDFDASTAYEIGAHFDFQVLPFLSVGLAPAFLFNIKSPNDTDSAKQLDLPLRITAGANLIPQLRLYGFVAPGYTILFPPSDPDTGETMHPSGFMIGFGGGAGFKVTPKLAFTGEIGYQLRYPSETETVLGTPVDLTLQDNFLTFAIGIVAGL